MALSSINTLLQQIQSDDEETFYMAVTRKAMEWMAAGLVAEANALLEHLWSHNIPHTKSARLSDNALQVMWEVSNQYPSRIPFELQSIHEIEAENRARVVEENQFGQSVTINALTAARNNLPDKATYFIKLWGQGYIESPADYGLEDLLTDTRTAKYILSGILQSTFELTPDICRQQIQTIADKLAERMQLGRTSMYGELNWQQILNKISALAIGQNTYEFSEEARENNYLGKPPASTEAIDDAEKRLQVTLPDDYKQFLLTSNGFDCFSDIGVTIIPIEKVDYLMNVDTTQVVARTANPTVYNTEFSAMLSNSIIIGGILEERQLLLIPLGKQEIECWYLPGWESEETSFPGFRYFMEDELQKLESGYYST